ncbi:MAG: hypothetical protein H0V81_15495 [Solirubrobacterales bacterium]|nr:hypothetical protein [Solirubrobacterales bacterium]
MFNSFGRHVRQQFVGYLALFVALGGVSYAAVVLPRNSVGTAQIKSGAVRNSDLGRNAVTSGKVQDGSLLVRDFKRGQLVAGAPGPAGPGGAKGDTGVKGDAGVNGTNGTNGTNGATNVTVVRGDLSLAGMSSGGLRVNCPAGKRVTGGGVGAADGGIDNDRIIQSGPVGPLSVSPVQDTTTGTVPVSWAGRYFNGSASMRTFYVWAICSAP